MEKFSYLNRSNLEYIENQYQNFRARPEEVDPAWRLFFEGVEFAQSASLGGAVSSKELQVYDLIRYYRDYGHLKAHLDPLGRLKKEEAGFQLKNFGLSDSDLNQSFQVGSIVGRNKAPLKEVIAHLEKSYCGTLTAQVAECEPPVRAWFQNELESGSPDFQLSKDDRLRIHHSLTKTESLEKFIHSRFVGTKRFSVEGGDAIMPMLEHFVERGTSLKIEEVVIGMAHRGRLNVLANFMGKALDIIFAEFAGVVIDKTGIEGDVKYHMGYSADKTTAKGNCHVSLAFNPSHLEAVDPVVLGMTRAKQRRRLDTQTRKKVAPILIHGDAAFIGQGVVAETLQLSKLKGYTVGGTVHVIINNQVGFTTDPSDARSTRYSSDIAASIKAPVLLVNGDDAEACVRAMDMALRYRQEFGQDVVIDVICYRRFGHNEGDEPAFTQPLMYDIIKAHPTLRALYSQQLIASGVLTEKESEALYQEKMDNLQKILETTRAKPPEMKPLAFEGLWKGLRRGTADDFEKPSDTRVDKKTLAQAVQVLTEAPAHFHLHPKVQKLLQARAQMAQSNAIDWGFAELLCYASLRYEGVPVRISGQDAIRGTFTHRHAAYFDTETGQEFCPLKTINTGQGEFCVYNSPLSEMAVLGFEYGNSSSDPTFLTIWEAQFGDFSNGAQIIIDQFLASGEQKWMRMNGLTLLLPHGYEGQGPEHSSARLERFLQLCAQENMQVCNFTTPDNLFHALRRQVKRDFRKPLVIMSPKSLLRHPKVVCSLDALATGSFQEVIAEPRVTDPKKVEVLALCSGKVYYDIEKAREEAGKDSGKLAVVRVEQLYPFPKVQLTPFLSGYPKLRRVIWLQEEPANMGSAGYIMPKLREFMGELGLKKMDVEYIGRTERASPAVGSPRVHEKEQKAIVEQLLQTV